jgi:23S rRNA pseudouridine2604 synthase
MATLKLKKKPTAPDPSVTGNGAGPNAPRRAPLRGAGTAPRLRPTLAQAQAQREARDAALGLSRSDGPSTPDRPSTHQRRANPAQRADPSEGLARPEQTGQHRRQGPAPGARSSGTPSHPQSPSRQTLNAPAMQPPRKAPARPLQPARPLHPEQGARSSAGDAFTPKGRHNADGRPPVAATRPAPLAPARPVGVQAAAGAAGRPVAKRTSAFDATHVAAAQGAPHEPGSMRLSKRMSELGLASRREADEWIAKGWVRVDGAVVNELGARVLPHQAVTIEKKARQEQASRVTVLLNKPVGYVSGQAEDGYEPAFLLIKPENRWEEDDSRIAYSKDHLRYLVPAGRLDIDSVGLLVLTQDGRVAKQLIGENSAVEKEYLVRVERTLGGKLPDSDLALLRHGLELDGEPLQPAQVEWVNEDQLRFVLIEGKKRQIRRMCEGVGLRVLGLKRVRIGRLMLGHLPPGQWRYLKPDERFI